MAKEKEAKIVLERTYNVPLRRRWVNYPKYKRSKKAVTTLKEFIIRHMKPGLDEKGKIMLKIGKYLNEFIWKHGIKNPTHHVKVVAKKDDKGLVVVELEGAPVEKAKEEKPKKKEHTVKAEKTEEKKQESAKEIEKEELKELKKEKPKEHHQKMAAAPKKQLSKPTAPKSV